MSGDSSVSGGSRRDRDRDDLGRARNRRARDGLGRPLARGVEGVPRQPEGVARTAVQTLAQAQSLLDHGSPFEAHEVFEDAWKQAPSDAAASSADRELWRGLAQLAVGVTHAARGNRRGAVGVLTRAAATLAAFTGERPHGVAVDALVGWCRAAAEQLALPPGRTASSDAPETLTVPPLRG
jgi:hypothetical protein